MTFTAPLPMFTDTVVTARGVRSTANAATLAESELSVPPRAGQHDRVGAVGPRNGNAMALTVAKHGIWVVTGVLAQWRKHQ